MYSIQLDLFCLWLGVSIPRVELVDLEGFFEGLDFFLSLQNYYCKWIRGLRSFFFQSSRLLGIFLGRSCHQFLIFFNVGAVVFVMQASIFKILYRRPLASLFFRCFSLTWFHLIPWIHLMFEWWKHKSLLRLCFVRFHVSQPHSRAFRGLKYWFRLFCCTHMINVAFFDSCFLLVSSLRKGVMMELRNFNYWKSRLFYYLLVGCLWVRWLEKEETVIYLEGGAENEGIPMAVFILA